jgi:hypothetical protein
MRHRHCCALPRKHANLPNKPARDWLFGNPQARLPNKSNFIMPMPKGTGILRAEYRREDLGKGVRGKHHAAFKKGSNLVLLTPELAKIFPTNEAVNSALESLVGVARSAVAKPRRTSGTAAK